VVAEVIDVTAGENGDRFVPIKMESIWTVPVKVVCCWICSTPGPAGRSRRPLARELRHNR
jgi:hypothetical protein